MKEKTSAVTTIAPPHRISAARIRSVRGKRRVNHSPATRPISAAGSNQEISPPNAVPNIRPRPVVPPNPALPPPKPPPPPPAPPAPPKIRDNPLYPMASCHSELSVLPPMYGRESAGHSDTRSTYQPADTTSAAPAASRCQILVHVRARPAIR